MCGIIGGAVTLGIGAALVLASSLIGYVWVPEIVKNVIVGEVALLDESVALERFETVPFSLNFTVRVFNVSNADAVRAGGVPVMHELGPYVYRLQQTRELVGQAGDVLRYRRHETFAFDAALSHPRTEDDLLTIINVPYHAITQVAESLYPALMPVLNLALSDVFGEYNAPFVTVPVRKLLFEGLRLCAPGAGLAGAVACDVIRGIAAGARNIAVQDDGSLLFSILDYKEQLPSEEYEVLRGTEDPADLGRILRYGESRYFSQWTNPPEGGMSVCNHINGTDAGIFPPFVDTSKSIYAINTDICRSVELRYEFDTEYQGVPTVRFAANEWLLDNNEGCFCLNQTRGLTRPDGCLLQGAMELYTCVGAFLVLTYPHFLFADVRYRDGVVGMRPIEENHKIFIDIEPNTGTPVRAAKRAQFNIFSRRVAGIPPTEQLRTALVPILWIEEAINLPEEFASELTDRLLRSLRLVDILIPVLIAFCGLILLAGVVLTVRARRRAATN
nr:sensory neuron membrane protein [Athetis lepigone]